MYFSTEAWLSTRKDIKNWIKYTWFWLGTKVPGNFGTVTKTGMKCHLEWHLEVCMEVQEWHSSNNGKKSLNLDKNSQSMNNYNFTNPDALSHSKERIVLHYSCLWKCD
jgi:hypothetical protein